MNSAYDALDMGKKGFEWLFESEIKIGRYLMSGGMSAKPTSTDLIVGAMNFVGLGAVGKLGWRVLTGKGIGKLEGLISGKALGVTGSALGYGMLTGKVEQEPGFTEAFWAPSGMAPMGVWGGVKETSEALTKPIGLALSAGYLDIAETGMKSAREQRDDIFEYFQRIGALTPTISIVGEMAIKTLDRTLANYQKKLDYAKYVLPNIKHQQEQIEEETKIKAANLRALDANINEYNKLNEVEQRVLKARFRTPAEIGGIKVDSELSAMESIWGQNIDMMTTAKAMLIRSDPYADYDKMVSTERLHSKGVKVQLAKLNLGFVRAAKGTESKDRAMVALQQAQAHEQLRLAESTLDITTEAQRVAASDTLTISLEKQQLRFKVSQIDFQLAYTMQHELVMMAHAKQTDASDSQPKTLQAVKDKLTELWAEQSTLEISVTDYAGKVKTNEETAAGYAKQLVELEEEYIDPLEVSMSELNNIIRMM